MCQIGIVTSFECVKTYSFFFVGTKYTLRIEKSKQKHFVSQKEAFAVLWHQWKEQLQLWEAIPLVGKEINWWSKSWICGNACIGTTRGDHGSHLAATDWEGPEGDSRGSPSRGRWRSVNILVFVLFSMRISSQLQNKICLVWLLLKLLSTYVAFKGKFGTNLKGLNIWVLFLDDCCEMYGWSVY